MAGACVGAVGAAGGVVIAAGVLGALGVLVLGVRVTGAALPAVAVRTTGELADALLPAAAATRPAVLDGELPAAGAASLAQPPAARVSVSTNSDQPNG